MLVQLRVANFAVIENVELLLQPGLTVITGETGAGKSIIVDAIGLLRGGRASAEVVRKGCAEAVVEALFDLSGCPGVREAVEQLGLPLDGSELAVRRVVPRQGRGRAYINGSLCTAAMLAQVTGRLVDITGQHEHQALADRGMQRAMLDDLGTSATALAAMREAFERLHNAAEALSPVQLDEHQRVERLDFLRFQVSELDAAHLVAGEEEELEARLRRLAHAAELRAGAEQAESALYSDDGAVCETLGTIARRLRELQGVDPALEPLLAQLEEARVLIEDAAAALGRYAEGVEVDAEQLAEVEQRLELVHRLRRKHGASSVEQVIAKLESMRQELVDLERLTDRRDELEQELSLAREAARVQSLAITQARQRSAQRLAREVALRLEALRMPGARLSVDVGPRSARDGDDPALVFTEAVDAGEGKATPRRVTADGWDRVELAVALNPGEDLMPVGRVASGGELSRLMLALCQVLGAHDPVPTSIFDEVDSGIGGAVADVVGAALAEVAAHRQVLVVTHLPQVAAYGEHHFTVSKAQTEGRTRTMVTELPMPERIEELARMLAASEVTAEARAHAKQLIDRVHKPKPSRRQRPQSLGPATE